MARYYWRCPSGRHTQQVNIIILQKGSGAKKKPKPNTWKSNIDYRENDRDPVSKPSVVLLCFIVTVVVCLLPLKKR